MCLIQKIDHLILLVSLTFLFSCSKHPTSSQDVSQYQKVSLDKQINVFKELGFTLNPGVSYDQVIELAGKNNLENEPYALLYYYYSIEIGDSPWITTSNNCWHFDMEYIEDEEAYVSILQNLERISNGELFFKNKSDVVDWDNERASVSFEIKGDKYNWELEFDYDWADPNFFSMIVQLTEKYNTKGRFTYYSDGGQDLIIGWATPNELNEIRDKTGLEITWLN